MSVLATLLPGVRQLRAPLAAGYLWVLTAWILVHDHIGPEETAEGPLKALYEVRSAASAVALAVAASFAAYIVGSLTETLASRVAKLESTISYSAEDSLNGIALRRLNEIARLQPGGNWWTEHAAVGDQYKDEDPPADSLLRLDGPAVFSHHVTRAHLQHLIRKELPLVARRLIGEKPALHAEVDRLRAEGELRVAIAAPLATFITVFAWAAAWSWYYPALPALATVVAIFLALAILEEGRMRFVAANELLADILALGDVQLPSLERLGARAELDLRASGSKR